MCNIKIKKSGHKYIYISQTKGKKKKDRTSKNILKNNKWSFWQTKGSPSGLPLMPLKSQAQLNYSCINSVTERNNSALHFLSQAQRQNSLKNCLCKGFTIFLFISFEIKAHEEISLARQIVQLWNSLPRTFMEAEITVYRHSSKGIR